MILHDQHVHSIYSEDSKALLKDYKDVALKMGVSYFVTTEHLDLDTSYTKCDWVVDYPSLKKELNDLFKNTSITPLLGIEIGYRKDHLEEITKWANCENFDIINLSIHDNGKIEYYFKELYLKYGIDNCMKDYYNQMKDAVETFKNYDVLSHIDYGYKTAYLADCSYDFWNDLDIIKEILTIIIKDGKALEINSKVQNYLDDSHLPKLLDFYKSLGGTKLTISSDAHSVDRYLDGFDKLKKIIKDAGFSYLCYYINRKEYHYDI